MGKDDNICVDLLEYSCFQEAIKLEPNIPSNEIGSHATLQASILPW